MQMLLSKNSGKTAVYFSSIKFENELLGLTSTGITGRPLIFIILRVKLYGSLSPVVDI